MADRDLLMRVARAGLRDGVALVGCRLSDARVEAAAAAIVDRHAGTALPVLVMRQCIRDCPYSTMLFCRHPSLPESRKLIELGEDDCAPPSWCPLRERTTP